MWASSVTKCFHIRVKPSAVAIWICFLIFDPSIYTLLLFLAMLIHECGHLAALFLCGKREIRMIFSAFGAEITYDGFAGGVGRQVMVALGGIVFNLLSAMPVLTFWGEGERGLFFAVASLMLACLNLIPIKGLDGGVALEAILLNKTDPDTAYFAMRRISIVCIVLLFLLSVLVLIGSSFNFSLLLLTLYLALSIFR